MITAATDSTAFSRANGQLIKSINSLRAASRANLTGYAAACHSRVFSIALESGRDLTRLAIVGCGWVADSINEFGTLGITRAVLI